MFVLGFLIGIALAVFVIWLLVRGGGNGTPPPNPKASITDLERQVVHELLETELAARAASVRGSTRTTEVTPR